MKEVQVDGENICIVNIEGKYYVIGSIITHEGGPLADGTLEGYEVECPWHGSKFDVRTGEVMSPPASEPEPTYQVKVEGNNILIKKQGTSKPSQLELTLIEKDFEDWFFIVKESIKFRDKIQALMKYNAGIIREETKLQGGLKGILELKKEFYSNVT